MSDTPEQIIATEFRFWRKRGETDDVVSGDVGDEVLAALRDAGWSIVRLEEADEDTLRVVWKGKIP